MTTDRVTGKPEITAQLVIEHLRSAAPDAESIYYVYVLDEVGYLAGVVSLGDLIAAAPTQSINSITGPTDWGLHRWYPVLNKCPRGDRMMKRQAEVQNVRKPGASPKKVVSSTIAKLVRSGVLITIGAVLVAVGLEIFLVPNNIIDGGVVGLAIMSAHLSNLPIALFLILFNLPFLWLGYKQIGLTFAVSTLYAVAVMSVFVSFLHPVPVITNDLLLAAVFGGTLLGVGVGLIIRNGGSLDGTEIVAIVLSPKIPFSVGEVVMFFNFFILGSAGFVFGWDHAMYSLIAYFVAYKVIDVTVQGLDESKSAMIVTSKPEAIRQAILHRLGRGVTEVAARGGYSQEQKALLYCVVTRLEVAKLKNIVSDHDQHAFVVIENVHDVLGGRTAKRSIH